LQFSARSFIITFSYYGHLDSAKDYRDYEFVTGEGVFACTLSNIPEWSDYDLYLLNCNKETIASSIRGGNVDEYISKSVTIGLYYVRVYCYSGGDSTRNYHLYGISPDQMLAPELRILNITASDSNPIVGQYITLTTEIINFSAENAPNSETAVFKNLELPPEAPMCWANDYLYNSGILGPFEHRTFTEYFVTSYSPTTWHIYGLVDCNDLITELNDCNNTYGPLQIVWREPPPKPDLIVQKVAVSSYCPHVSETLYVEVTILNQGVGSTSPPYWFPTSIYYNHDTLNPPKPCWGCYGDEYWYTSSLDPGYTDSYTFSTVYNPSLGDVWNMYIVVDSDSSVDENYETNNVYGPIQIQWEAGFPRASPITRDKIIENAMTFTTVEWVCPTINATSPSECSQWRSNYIVGETYWGEAYKWGGSASPSCFIEEITKKNKRAGALGVPSSCSFPYTWASGVECCGLVWHSLDDTWHSTKNLDEIGYLIPGWVEYLLKGDFLLTYDKHTFIFESWAGEALMNVIEAGDFRDRDPDHSSEARRWPRPDSFYTQYNAYKYKNVQESPGYDPNRAGDANSDGRVDAVDVTHLINYLFKGSGIRPHPNWRGDANGDCKVSVGDVVYLMNYLYKGGNPPYYCTDCPGRTCFYY